MDKKISKETGPPFNNLDHFSAMLASFLSGHWPPEPQPNQSDSDPIKWNSYTKPSEKAKLIAKIILNLAEYMQSDQRSLLLNEISKRFFETQNHDVTKMLKAELRSKEVHSWKLKVLGQHTSFEHKVRFTELACDNNANLPLSFESHRFRIFEPRLGRRENSLVIQGSSFVTNKQQTLSKINHVLDGICSAYTFNSKNEANGFMLALADGAGHFNDVTQNRMIANAAYFCGKHLLNLMGQFNSADELKKQMLNLLKTLTNAMRYKRNTESTSLLCLRAFRQEKSYRLIVANVGDAMLCAWTPNEKLFRILAPAQRLAGGKSPALLPQGYNNYEVDIRDLEVPFDTILLAMSDGVWESLPFITTPKPYPNQTQGCEYSLNPQEIISWLTPLQVGASVEEICSTLIRRTVQQIESERQRRISQRTATKEEPIELGDDVSLAAIRLGEKLLPQDNIFHSLMKKLHLDGGKEPSSQPHP